MRLLKALLVVVTLALAGIVAAQSICINPFTPGCECDQARGIQICDAAAGGPYADAIAVWSFNDPADLGNQDAGSCGSCDLTPVAAPTATGGALGYAADFDNAANQYASSTSSSLNIGATDSYGIIAWVRPDVVDNRYGIWSGGTSADTNLQADNPNIVRFTADAVTIINGTLMAGTRTFLAAWFDNPNDLLHLVVDETTITPVAEADAPVQDDGVFRVGLYSSTNDFPGAIGPVMFYKATAGTLDLTTIAASVYNSGKGKTCTNLTAAEQVDLVSCWDMTENGGPYADSVGSNTLTGINTPTRVAGLVERSDSGMSVRLNDTDGSHLISTDTSLARGDQDFTVSLWVNPYGVTGTLNLAIGQDATPDFDFIIQHVDSFLRCRKENDAGVLEAAAVANAYTLGVWRMATLRYTASSNLLECGVDDDAFTGTTLASDGMAMVGAHQFTVGYTSSEPNAAIDNLGFWPVALTDAQRTTLYNSGAGTFYAAFLDFIFNGPRFAWSQSPQIRRVES